MFFRFKVVGGISFDVCGSCVVCVDVAYLAVVLFVGSMGMDSFIISSFI